MDSTFCAASVGFLANEDALTVASDDTAIMTMQYLNKDLSFNFRFMVSSINFKRGMTASIASRCVDLGEFE